MQIPMSIKGLMMDPITNMPIVILHDPDGRRVLPIWVGVFEANAIALQIENVATPRPMTHDLLRTMIDELDARVTRIVINELRESTFYAQIRLIISRAGSESTLEVDARPSDAIALALRTEAPIFVSQDVLEQAQTLTPEAGSEEHAEKTKEWFENLSPEDLGKYKM